MALEDRDSASITTTTTTESMCVKELIEEYKRPLPPKKSMLLTQSVARAVRKIRAVYSAFT